MSTSGIRVVKQRWCVEIIYIVKIHFILLKMTFLFGGQNVQFSSEIKILYKKDCVWFYWLTWTALLPTWGSQWFVSGMAELLSGRRAYVTGAADNTWVLSWGLGEWPGSLRETERSPQPTASALGGAKRVNSLLGLGTQVCVGSLWIIYEENMFMLFFWHYLQPHQEKPLSTATVFYCWPMSSWTVGV